MILLNFGGKMQKTGFEQFNALTGLTINEQIMLPVEFNNAHGFIKDVDSMFTKVKLSLDEIKQDRLVLIPPANGYAAGVLLVELHRRTGRFPYLIRTRLPLYGLHLGTDVVEVIDLEKEWSAPE